MDVCFKDGVGNGGVSGMAYGWHCTEDAYEHDTHGAGIAHLLEHNTGSMDVLLLAQTNLAYQISDRVTH